MIEVIKPGLFDLVMDLGRPGFRSQGVPAGGAADIPALIAANRLVGNLDQAAGLEMTLSGPTLRFPEGAVVALTGAVVQAVIGNADIPMGQRTVLPPGAVIRLARMTQGLRTYLAVAGGIAVPLVLNSRSSFTPGGFGGGYGRALRTGDWLPVGEGGAGCVKRTFCEGAAGKRERIRVIPGPQIGVFSDAALTSFSERAFRVSADINRLGIRLQAEAVLSLKAECNNLAVSQGVLPGAIQVPPDGHPIILGWDGPVTGGYPVIAGVIAADMPYLAQCCPGDAVRFEFVTRAQALDDTRSAKQRGLND